MAPEVFFSVCYGESRPPKAIRALHTFCPAVLDNHCRHRIKHADYPAVVAEKGRSVRGVYATGLTDAHVKKLDDFEGAEYDRVEAKVQLLHQTQDGKEAAGEVKDTCVYVWLQPERLEKREWDFAEFRRDRMQFWTRGGEAFSQGADDEAIMKSAV